MMDIRDALFQELYFAAEKDKRIIVLTADADAFYFKHFREKLPDQIINVGVSEQNAILVAAGLAKEGYRPVVYSITPFLAMRAFEQIKVNICSMFLPVILIGLGAGFSFSFDGPTHHAVNDIGLLRSLPELAIYNTSDEETAAISIQSALADAGPSFIRLDKGSYSKKTYSLWDNGSRFLKRPAKTTILTTGTITEECLKVEDVGVLEFYKLNPIHRGLVNGLFTICKKLVVVEEHIYTGGLFSIIAELAAVYGYSGRLIPITLPNAQFFDYAERPWLLNKYGLTAENITRKINA